MRLTAVELDLGSGTVARDGAVAALRPVEQALLRYLIERPGRTVPRDELLAAVWGYRDGVRSRTLDTTVKTLRKKLEADPARPDHLRTVHGVGYCFEPIRAAAVPAIRTPLGALFGRDTLRAHLASVVRDERLVTLVGPGGMGKTRLALALAADAPPALVVDLAHATTDHQVYAEVARALEVPLGRDPAAVGRALAARGAIRVVLDNAESLDPGGAAAIAALAEAAPAARLVVTSRRPLRVHAELRIEVPPLDPGAAAALLLDRGRR
ncbi:MAG: winged helix-turn-helix domain-containing protein, partial [Myxococcota bacterium]